MALAVQEEVNAQWSSADNSDIWSGGGLGEGVDEEERRVKKREGCKVQKVSKKAILTDLMSVFSGER